jgi:hypothetical protein
MELMQASKQWASRPNDERFTSLYDLRDSVLREQRNSRARVVSSKALEFVPDEANPMEGLKLLSKATGNTVAPTNWSFGQVANRIGAPASYVRTLAPALAADCLNWGLMKQEAEDIGVLVGLKDDGTPETLRAATGPRYGRVWNSDIANSLCNMFGDGATGDWKVPGEFGVDVPITKSNTTLYASDRDMFVFLADEHNRIELPNRRNGKAGSLARGFFVWNSEVGSQSFGMAAFLFDYVCMNRIVWGATEYKESRFRHTASAPDKWLDNVAPVIEAYSKASVRPYEAALIGAQNKRIDDVSDFFANRKFGTVKLSKKAIHGVMAAHEDEEGRPIETLWDAATGLTAYAKGIEFQDERVELERAAGKILDLAL